MRVTLLIVLCSFSLILSNSQNVIYLNPGCNKFNEDGNCVSCSVRFYQDDNGICQPVNPNCNGYNPDTGACTTCYPGFAIVEDTCLPQFLVSGRFDPFCNEFEGSVCVKCSFGYFFDSQRKCKQADPNCKQFDEDNGFCVDCYQGFEISGTGCVPAKQETRDPNCNQYQDGRCLKCSFGFYFNQFNICTLIPVDCADFDIPNRICRGCYTGYALNDNNRCQQSDDEGGDPNCNEFNDGACLKCSFGFYFNDFRICTKIPVDCADFDIPNRRCRGCYTGYALDANNRCIESEQQGGDPNCNEFNDGACVKCSFGFYFNDFNVCTKIPDDCQSFSIREKVCKQCYTGYELNINNLCVESQQSVNDPNCNQFDSDGVCLKCSFGFYFNFERKCKKIPDDCLDFRTSEERCVQCYTGYALDQNNNCVESEDDLTDPNCNEFNEGVCVKCSFGFYFNAFRVCTKIPDECKRFDTETEKCEQCYIGYTLDSNNVCIESDEDITDKFCKKWENSTCVQCSQGSYLSFDNFCKLVSPLCKTHNPNNGKCTSCYPGYALDDDDEQCQVAAVSDLDPNCKEFNGQVCVECSFRFFRNFEGACQSVNPLCKTYSEFNGACQTCYIGFKVEGDICIEDEDVIDDPNCANWVDGICTQCSFGAFFAQNGKCELVDLLCKTYDERNGACKTCYPAFRLEGTKCIEDQGFASQDPFCSEFNNGVCTKCSKGFYFSTIDGICTKVSDLCQTYDQNTGACLSCYLGFVLDTEKGACVEDDETLTDNNCAEFIDGRCMKCSQGFYFNPERICQVSNPLCKQFNPVDGACTQCYIGFARVNGNCLVSDEQESRDPNCAEWLDDTICLRCSERAFFNDLGFCQLVSVDCNGFDVLTGRCTTCYAGYDLDQNRGVCERSTSQSGCLERDDNGVCTKCPFRSYLNNFNDCTAIDDLCAQFDFDRKVCVGCYSGYSLLNRKCQITEVQEGKQIDNCFAYTPEGNCLECFERYYLKQADECAQVDLFCKGYNKISGACTSCYEGLGFNLEDGKCLK